ncbi:MAG TPA: Asp-tRNA(Asn)/Glu-tRNA(Gln) amidotransferase subunit GatB [Chitinophagales bacterium]|nr:Asp-tRNA(Asn)/Glu-tRNA(Gln) amidotransferase subunit GatB [Chitinophagales bacterium]HNA58580.1 Asp-tRNA(Asn)/Glu-tRNA(Gln) amidotransferase subunit GatB [Chitinophagales bacterium]HNF68462.1 Asp-tRNA(Asn)/Glu-tRNA(Gln) amidotransferase subunit GatB [Chitinophagales bacterium]HNI55315.1 Asp-tRNA(Asn)/Glu-tRNA(Gln) amidotransferase subunit GatB [Chitinophagales bacterium]HNK97511.1 Asp-tRNA(Asn)/Glu-tRNA(Gln) amidotransferase subunit GatB [Chitinophagales bacterium]
MEVYDKYEAVIGLEVHAQLLTRTKAYSSDIAAYGGEPNSYVSPVTLGHPGTLPVFNAQSLNLAMRLGLALHCQITRYNEFARKNYFYVDLPKGYQITQDKTPICTGGHVDIGAYGQERIIRLTRIHMEEDAGKSIHDLDPFYTLVDLNRAGTPLVEIVSEPDLRSGDEAYAYLTEIRRLVRYLDICDGNMEEGSLRCDANVSVRLKGAAEFGVKVEVKNMNSIRNVKRAIDYEIKRQIDAIEAGETIVQETRSFDAAKGSTFSMRSKEAAHDYRYFPEPDLQPFIVSDAHIADVKANMPALPRDLMHKYVEQCKLSVYDAEILTAERDIALYFEELIALTNNFKAAANWMQGPVKSWLNEHAENIEALPIKPAQIAELIALTESGKLNFTIASQQLFPAMLENAEIAAEALAGKLNLIQQSDAGEIEKLVEEAISKYPEKVAEYRSGKKGILGLFMGEVMKLSKGKADPKLATRLLEEKLNA